MVIKEEKSPAVCDECMEGMNKILSNARGAHEAGSIVYHCDHNSVFVTCGFVQGTIVSWTLLHPFTREVANLVVSVVHQTSIKNNQCLPLNAANFLIENKIKH